jgi:hypothetical protein
MYRLTDTSTIVRLADGAFIPADPGNSDYQTYLDWVAAGNAPEPVPVFDWRPQAIADLNTMRAKLLGILSSMQMDYVARDQTANADAVLAAKDGVKVIETAAGVQTAYQTQPGSRAAFDLAVKTRWTEIVSPAPAEVKSDFNKYGGNTV